MSTMEITDQAGTTAKEPDSIVAEKTNACAETVVINDESPNYTEVQNDTCNQAEIDKPINHSQAPGDVGLEYVPLASDWIGLNDQDAYVHKQEPSSSNLENDESEDASAMWTAPTYTTVNHTSPANSDKGIGYTPELNTEFKKWQTLQTPPNEDNFHRQTDLWTTLSREVVQAPVQYIESMPGKKIRDRAAHAFNVWLHVEDKDLSRITQIINLLHSASLILDDVEDGSTSRRGKPAAHMIFGVPQAINSAGFQINRALIETMKLESSECLEIFSEEMEKLYVGQGYDLYWTFNTHRPTFMEYVSMVDYKTGALFNMLVKLMVVKSSSKLPPHTEIYSLVALLGRYFQIRDDYMNLTSDEYTDQKGFCEDLDEGKFSLILIHALVNSTETHRSILEHILAQRHKVDHMLYSQKKQIIDILKAAGSLDFTIMTLRDIASEIDRKLAEVEKNVGIVNHSLRALVDMLRI